MSKEQKPAKPTSDGREDAYRLAKQLRAGNRELARQLNTKKTRKQR